MGKEKRYRNFEVRYGVYVSSSYHYHFYVSFDEYRKGENTPCGYYPDRCYAFGVYQPMDRNFPKYVERAVEEGILHLLKSGAAVFYEYDRDGCKRYEDLRYYDDEEVKRMIKVLERRVYG